MKAISFTQTLFLFICIVMHSNSINAMKRQGNEIVNYYPKTQPVPKKIKALNQIANFFCNECTKNFATERGLSYHKSLTHKQTKNIRKRKYHCDRCPKSFCDNHSLKRHYRSHTGEKPFQCNICFQPFRDKSNCNQHREKCFQREQQTITYAPMAHYAFIKAVNNNIPNSIINTYSPVQTPTYVPLTLPSFVELELSSFDNVVQASGWNFS